jgi:hypothetical protein
MNRWIGGTPSPDRSRAAHHPVTATTTAPTAPSETPSSNPAFCYISHHDTANTVTETMSLMQNIGNLPITAPSAEKSGKFSTRRTT